MTQLVGVDNKRWERPARIGLSVGHPIGTCGSIGPFVRSGSGQIGFISTASVLAPNKASPGDYIHQPAPPDISLSGETRFAMLSNLIARPQEHSKDNLDIAVAWLLDDNVGHRGTVVPPGTAGSGDAITCGAAGLGDRVALAGRTTGISHGLITAVGRNNVAVRAQDGLYHFDDCIEVRGMDGAFSRPGDGGGLVWRTDDAVAIGILFAAVRGADDAMLSIVLPLQPILERFGLTMA